MIRLNYLSQLAQLSALVEVVKSAQDSVDEDDIEVQFSTVLVGRAVHKITPSAVWINKNSCGQMPEYVAEGSVD